ncbi:MAG TPA: 2-C-methyl-D-erythritol 4-phosphate cytidylyltransferase [Rhabdochlamydiaceae bacterium]|nr:2-C-methyl-D-erythritol 4-phosphate cytidylyltransferase [Rhabdochlamydiaceae bacterium]HSX13226.1 2-C-methyl-D-erythritol 4-phosphate cytidylyltransferase [Chlamydiales bacterium]
MTNRMAGICAILLMGGSGKRFGSGVPKQFHRLSGKNIYLRTLDRFLESNLFDEIILVCPSDWIDQVKKELLEYRHIPDFKMIKTVAGGETRQASSYAGLTACSEKTTFVVIHDAVRPFIDKDLLQKHVTTVQQYGAVDTCISSMDTIVHSKDGLFVDAIPERAEFLRGQTPQSFDYTLILSAHLRARESNLFDSSDDCRLIKLIGKPIHIIEGDEHNLKITNETDLILAEHLLRLKQIPSVALSTPHRGLFGKKFAVTGGTGGIGQAICNLLEREGAIPIIISRNAPEYAVDLTNCCKTQEAFEQIYAHHGPLDGLINSLGMFKHKEVKDTDYPEIRALIETNLTGLIYSCKSVKLKPGAHIINIASSSYSRGRKNISVYSSAKAAVVNFTQGLAEERLDLKINAIVPPRTNTEMRKQQFPTESPDLLLPPEKVADAVLELLKQDCITGGIIEVSQQILGMSS